jgi:hypothetical protein
MSFDYLEKSIQRNEEVKKKIQKKKHINNKILNTVKQFITDKKLVCYGGTAINDILPKEEQFYNYETDIPDYDFFSPNAMNDAKDLCNIFSKQNVHSVESKSAFVHGTYKVFVNFVAVADITQIDEKFYNYLLKTNNHIKKDNVLYTPPSYLRMSLHQELARPLGDISRWDKIFSRLQLFNKYFPVLTKNKMITYETNEDKIDISEKSNLTKYNELFEYFKINNHVFCNFDIIISSLYKFMKLRPKKKDNFNDIFIVYTNKIKKTKKEINALDIDVKTKYVKSIYKFVNDYLYLYSKEKLIGIVFETNSCLSYNTIKYKRQPINIGNVDTLMNLYFTLVLIDTPINPKIVLEVINKLQNVVINYTEVVKKYESASSVPEKLKRFSLPCYGEQPDREDILKERSSKYKQMKSNRTSKEYKEWFFKYSPNIKKSSKTRKKKK